MLFIYIYQLAEIKPIKRKTTMIITGIINVILILVFFMAPQTIINEGDLMDLRGIPINTLYISSTIYILLMILSIKVFFKGSFSIEFNIFFCFRVRSVRKVTTNGMWSLDEGRYIPRFCACVRCYKKEEIPSCSVTGRSFYEKI